MRRCDRRGIERQNSHPKKALKSLQNLEIRVLLIPFELSYRSSSPRNYFYERSYV
jgi:hypothetical protein